MSEKLDQKLKQELLLDVRSLKDNPYYSEEAIELVVKSSDLLLPSYSAWRSALQATAERLGLSVADHNDIPIELEKHSSKDLPTARESNKQILGFTGPGGAGKDTVAAELDAIIVVQTTTREQRGYEKNGVDYWFLTEKEFKDEDYVHVIPKPNRGKYGFRETHIREALAENESALIIQSPLDSLIIAQKTGESMEDVDFGLVYVMPPGPVLPHLAIRLAKRCLEAGDPFDEKVIESTLGQRQIDEFLTVMDVREQADRVLYVVNDVVERAADVIRQNLL